MNGRLPAWEFARDVVLALRNEGYEAYLAGGCVRDHLMGQPAKDYDVATSAHPDEVRRIFRHRRTLEVGKAFGVIVVLGPPSAGSVEVATFREDAAYSDGRRPDSVRFSTPQVDAQRRDFTINGLFLDPVSGEVLDFVEGRKDLAERLVRAIGDPHVRFAEDKLRLLRAVRFATTLGFQVEPLTLEALRADRQSIQVVSAERIGEELRRLLRSPRRARGLYWLRESRLLEVLLPELDRVVADPREESRLARLLESLDSEEFPTALAALLLPLAKDASSTKLLVEGVGALWRLSNHEMERCHWLLVSLPVLRTTTPQTWPRTQRQLATAGASELLRLAEATAQIDNDPPAPLEFCRGKLAQPEAVWNPPPLLNGDDLMREGLSPGPIFTEILHRVRDAQLLGVIGSHGEALQWARRVADDAGRLKDSAGDDSI